MLNLCFLFCINGLTIPNISLLILVCILLSNFQKSIFLIPSIISTVPCLTFGLFLYSTEALILDKSRFFLSSLKSNQFISTLYSLYRSYISISFSVTNSDILSILGDVYIVM
ncbi:NADH dehydrogenase subunit 5 [Bacillus thuringiensis serovar huazhongensis BGSC 4BD1]|nr:NADH dehydrogenase subunit 5 [Bacillus thuringiensis serovar huazhongensis BGSC 4BD1]